MFETVNYSVAEGIASIALNRPARLNAINGQLLADFLGALRAANADEDVRAILLSGEGRAFCAGDDLKEFSDQSSSRSRATAFVDSIQDISRAMLLNEKIVIESIHGWAVGGGLEWVINCDLTVVADDARFFFPETSLGVFVTGAVTALLPGMIGRDRARRLILLGERFGARDARDLGFDWIVTTAEERPTRARAVAKRIASLPQGPVRHLKRAMALAPYSGIEAALGLETVAAVDGFLDPESRARAEQAISGR